jgi:hypothetical protein
MTVALATQRLGVRLGVLAFVCGAIFWQEARLRQDERERARRDPVKAPD